MATSNEIAKVTTYNTVVRFLGTNDTIVSSSPLLKLASDRVKTQVEEMNAIAGKAGIDTTGHTESKNQLKAELAEMAATFCGYAVLYFEAQGMTEEANELSTNVSDYTKLSDTEMGIQASNALDLMTDHKDGLDPDFVSKDELDKFEALITTYKNTKGDAAAVITASPATTEAFRAAVKKAGNLVDNLLTAAPKVKKTNPVFFNDLQQVTIVRYPAGRHNSVVGVITDFATGQPISGAKLTLAVSKITQVSDKQGEYEWDSVRKGSTELTAEAAGYNSVTRTVSIKRGVENTFDIALTKV